MEEFRKAFAVATVLLLCYTLPVSGHGMMIHPVSRNFLAYLQGKEWCPHCLNAGGSSAVSSGGQLVWPASSHGYCGDRAGEQKWDVPGALQAVYTPGQVINVDYVVTENHLGRIDMQLCDVTAKPGDNKCMALQRADGKSSMWYLPFIASWSGGNRGSEKPIYSDGSFGMYTMPDVLQEEGCTGQYICSGYKGQVAYRTQWQLPAQVPCKRCKLMWTYLTAHNCWPPCAPANADEITCENKQDFATCGARGAQYPESFWNCADVRISNTGNTSDDTSDDYQIPADIPGSQQRDEALTHATTRRDLPAWEAKISISSAPFGVPRVVKMHSGGWRMEMAPRIRKDTARQMPDEQSSEQPTEVPSEQPSDMISEQPDAADEIPGQEPTQQQLAPGTASARRMLLH